MNLNLLSRRLDRSFYGQKARNSEVPPRNGNDGKELFLVLGTAENCDPTGAAM